MIEKDVLRLIPFPFAFFYKNEIIFHDNGSLFRAEKGLRSDNQLTFYSNAEDFWSTCPEGYAIYKFNLQYDQNYSLVIFGLKVKGISNVSGKQNFLSIKVEKEHIEHIHHVIDQSFGGFNKSVQKLFTVNMHEIRTINTDIYHTSTNLIDEIDDRGFSEGRHLNDIKRLKSLSEVMTVRSTFIDVVSDPSIIEFKGKVFCPFGKFYKLTKSLESIAKSKRIKLNIEGDSESSIQAVTCFDVLPYILISNAIKYSPQEKTISIDFEEDQISIYIKIKSLGPIIYEEEKSKIFSYGFRGKNAKNFSNDGGGVGLYFANKIVDSCPKESSIEIIQNGEILTINGIDFVNTEVKIKFQIHEKRKTIEAESPLLKFGN